MGEDTTREWLESCATPVEICKSGQERPSSCQLPSPERTSPSAPSFLFALSSRCRQEGSTSSPAPPSAPLAARHNLSTHSIYLTRLDTGFRPSTAAERCLTSPRLLPETSHTHAFACRNARQHKPLKVTELDVVVPWSLFASRPLLNKRPRPASKPYHTPYCSLHQP